MAMMALAAMAWGAGDTANAGQITRTSKGAPKRADGYWALKNVGGGGTVIGTQYVCVGANSEERGSILDQIALNVNCSTYEVKATETGSEFHIVCGKPPETSETTGKVSGDFAKAYKVEMTVKESDLTQTRTIDASNGGACPAGVAPGDLMDDKGKKVANILN